MKEKDKKFSSVMSKIKFISGILSWVILVILVIIAMFLLYYFVSAKMYAQKGEKYKPAFSLYTILSPSMVPNIKVYDVIVDVNVKNPEDIKEGDIITFVSTSSLTKGMTITHRVVQIKEEDGKYSYVTKGDANLSPDASPAPFENVQGKVLFHIPQLGRVQEFLGTKGGWLLVVVLPALYIIITDLLKVFRLKTVKNQVESYENQEDFKNKKAQLEKEEIQNRLQERYQVESTPEEDIIKEQEIIPDKEESISEVEDAKVVLPNLKEDDDLEAEQEEENTEEESENYLVEDNLVDEEEFEDMEEVEEVETQPEIVYVHGQELVKPKRKRKRKRKRKKKNNSQNQGNQV